MSKASATTCILNYCSIFSKNTSDQIQHRWQNQHRKFRNRQTV